MATMLINPRPPEKSIYEPACGQDLSTSRMLCKTSVVERLPFALDYAANLAPQDHAVLFYDNLVVAAEYFCAFIEEGIRRQEVTCITGLEHKRYSGIFEQVGIRVAELENCGYLRNISNDQFHNGVNQLNWNGSARNIDDLIHGGLDGNPSLIRFIHIQGPSSQQDGMLQSIMEDERRTHRFRSLATISICCYDAKLVLEDAPPDVFTELLKTHNHCFFQGIAMQTSRLLGPKRNTIQAELSS